MSQEQKPVVSNSLSFVCSAAFDGWHGSMKPEGCRRCKTMAGG
jgi:hypothetical protein